MSEPGRLKRSLRLLQVSLRVIAVHPRLAVFPLASAALGLVVLLVFLGPLLAAGPAAGGWGDPAHWHELVRHAVDAFRPWQARGVFPWAASLRVLGLYLAAMFGATFLNVAFYHEIIEVLAGGRVSLRRGFASAVRRLGAILAWTLFASSVGFVLRLATERFGFVGRLFLGAAGFSWSVAAVFVVPVLLRETGANPVRFLRLSTATVARTWGEFVTGYVGVKLFPLLLLALLFPAAVLLPHVGTVHLGRPLLEALAVAWTAAYLGTAIVAGAVNAIFRCALYVYASEGAIPQPFTPEMLDAAWKVGKPLRGPASD